MQVNDFFLKPIKTNFPEEIFLFLEKIIFLPLLIFQKRFSASHYATVYRIHQ